MCLVGATHLFEDNRRGMGEASIRCVGGEGERGIPLKGAGESSGAPMQGPFLPGHLGPVGRGRSSPEVTPCG